MKNIEDITTKICLYKVLYRFIIYLIRNMTTNIIMHINIK